MRRFILFALTIFICSFCINTVTKQKDPSDKTKKINLVSESDSIITKISEIANDIEYIALQPSANEQIRVIIKIATCDNRIYINSIDDIFCFDNHGHFLYKLYDSGKIEKDSIITIFDFDINTQDASMIVLAYDKILHFRNTGSGFDYIKTTKPGEISPVRIFFVPGTSNILLSFILNNGYGPSLTIVIDNNGDTLSFRRNYIGKFNQAKYYLKDEIIQYQFENILYFKDRFNDTVFSIDTESNLFVPSLILDSRLSSTNSENINDPEYIKILPNIVNILEVPRYLYYVNNFYHSDYKIFYDKYEDRKYEINTLNGLLKDDIGGGPDFDPKFCSEGKFYSWISARGLKKYVESEDFAKAHVLNPQKKEQLNRLARSLNETDNPVLIVVTCKNQSN